MIRPLVRLVTGSRWARQAALWAATAGAILLFLTNLRRAGERTGRLELAPISTGQSGMNMEA